MKKIFSLIIITLALLPLVQAQDAQYRLIRHTYKVNADGSLDYTFRKEIKLLRNRSFAAYGETYIPYNPAFETLAINEAYTIRQDGSRVNTPENAFVPQLPARCLNCARFSDIREMVVVHTALEYDAVSVLEYTIHRNNAIIQTAIQLQQDCPVERFEIVVDVPASQKLDVTYSKPLEGYDHPVSLTNDHSYHLVATDLKPTLADSYLPAADKLYNIVTISNGMKPALNATPTTIVGAEALLQELRKDDLTAYAVAIRNYVADNIRTNAIAPELLQYVVTSADKVWASGCGTIEEKALLMVSLLSQAGFSAKVDADHPQAALVQLDGMEHQLWINNKRQPCPMGVALDESRQLKVEKQLDWKADELADGFFRLTVPTEEKSLKVSATNLTSVRTAPVQARQCQEEYEYTVELPKRLQLIGGNVKQTLSFDGVGKVEIVVKQSGRKLSICRKLTLEKDIIMPTDYPSFLKLMQLWSQYRELYLKTK